MDSETPAVPLTVDEQFDAFLAQGEFRVQRCGSCEGYVFYPRILCPRCGSPDLTWVVHPGDGVVYSTTTIRRQPEKGGDYDLSLIDIGGGARMMSTVVGIAPTEVRIGLRVTAEIETDGDQPRVVFRPATGAVA